MTGSGVNPPSARPLECTQPTRGPLGKLSVAPGPVYSSTPKLALVSGPQPKNLPEGRWAKPHVAARVDDLDTTDPIARPLTRGGFS